MPPDNWYGNFFSIASGSGMRTNESSSALRAIAAFLSMPNRTRRLSESCVPIRRTGLSAVIGSWKIIDIPVPNSLRTWSRDIAESSLPSNMTLPERCTFEPDKRPIAARHMTVFPEPDSPTTPTLEPDGISRLTPRTASSDPNGVPNLTCKSVIDIIDVTGGPHDDRGPRAARHPRGWC